MTGDFTREINDREDARYPLPLVCTCDRTTGEISPLCPRHGDPRDTSVDARLLRSEEAYVVGLLVGYDRARAAENTARKRREELATQIKGWLDRHPGEELLDGEHGLRAYLQTRRGTESYDVTRMDAALLGRLQEARCLSVDVRVLRALTGKDVLPLDCRPYLTPGGETAALQVEATK